MKNSMIATAVVGLAASAQASILSTATGQAKVVSNCAGNVYVANVACDTSVAPITTTLNSSNPVYTQDFSQVTGNCGWSIKLGSDPSLPGDNILQYEYTWQGPGQQVWYDMSLVNQAGNAVFPWAFASSDTSTCNPNNANFFTEPETTTGMQINCPDDVTLTLYLCGTGGDSVSSVVSATASATSSAASSTKSSASSTTTTTPASSAPVSSAPASSSPTTLATSTKHGWGGWTVKEENVAAASTVTTSAAVSTSAVTSTTAADGVVVTETDVFYVTEVATTYVQARDAAPTPAAHKRHVHGHPHGGRA